MSFHHLSLSFKVAIQLLLEIWERKSLGMRYHISLTRKKWLLVCQTGNEIWNHLYQQKTGVGVCFCRWMESERKPRTMESLPRDLPFVLSMEWKHFFFFSWSPLKFCLLHLCLGDTLFHSFFRGYFVRVTLYLNLQVPFALSLPPLSLGIRQSADTDECPCPICMHLCICHSGSTRF